MSKISLPLRSVPPPGQNAERLRLPPPTEVRLRPDLGVDAPELVIRGSQAVVLVKRRYFCRTAAHLGSTKLMGGSPTEEDEHNLAQRGRGVGIGVLHIGSGGIALRA